MICPNCSTENTLDSQFCKKCATRLSLDSKSISLTKTLETPVRIMKPGSPIAGKYKILEEIGHGGMGVVYKAEDIKLKRCVALKFLPPHLMDSPELKERFLIEAQAAAALSHPNICVIHEVGESEDRPYIAMEYVDGQTLRDRLRKGPLAAAEALEIVNQVAAGLGEAHRKGIIHRDVKSANIMVTEIGQAKVMDFGLAKLRGGSSLTMSQTTLGTVAYMSPEQARGGDLDQRTDIWSLGVVLYEMLAGKLPFQGDHDQTVIHSILHEAPESLQKARPELGPELAQIVGQALSKKPAERYQTMEQFREDVAAVAEGLKPLRAGPAKRIFGIRRAYIYFALAVVLTLILGLNVGGLRNRLIGTAGIEPSGPTVSLAVLPFRNASGDPTMDSLGRSLSEVLATDLGEASHIRTIPSVRVSEVLRDLRVDPSVNLSPSDLARIADFVSAQTILWGHYVKFGEEIRIDATLQNLQKQTTAPMRTTAVNQTALLTAIAQLAASVQKTLAAGSTDVLNELKSSAWRPSTRSFEALRLYNDGLALSRGGNHQAALKCFEAAVAEDANFALVYSALAQTYANLGYDSQAIQQSRRAIGLSASLPAQERYLIAATHYRISNDNAKGIETYRKLLEVSPNNARIQYDLASLYERAGDLAKAQEHFAEAVALDPKYVEGLTAVGRVAIKSGDPKASLQPLNNALSLSIQLQNDEARATVLQAIGIAYKVMGQPAEALKQYQASLAIKRQIGQKRGMAVSLGEIGQIQELLGNLQEAAKNYNEALALQREIGNKSDTSLTLVNLGGLLNESLGRPDEALPLFREALSLLREEGNRQGEALALNNIGAAYLMKGELSEAQTHFERALEIREQTKVPTEMADTLHNLGETLGRMGKCDQALTHFLRALDLRRADGDTRSAAIESYSIGTVFDYQGRYGAAVKSKGEALQVFRDLKQRGIWLGEILSGLGYSLALGGRADEASRNLEEALTLARQMKNASLTAQVLRFQAENAFWKGDMNNAAHVAGEAVQTAAQTSDLSGALWSQFVAANISAAAQPTKRTAETLAQIGRRAEITGLIYLGISCALQRANALLRIGDRQQAREQVEQALAKIETLGLRELQARSEYILASTMRLAGDLEARRHYTAALQLIEGMKREDGSQNLLDRADLKVIHAECVKWSNGPYPSP
jgi:serine/threonine protein kinase/tetratricopeptide (TPR) repeat protein